MTTPEISPALSVQLKEKRDAAILEKHKEGLSNRAIAKLFKMAVMTVSDTVAKVYENPESGKPYTPRSPPPPSQWHPLKTAPIPARTPALLLTNSSTLCLQIDDPL